MDAKGSPGGAGGKQESKAMAGEAFRKGWWGKGENCSTASKLGVLRFLFNLKKILSS